MKKIVLLVVSVIFLLNTSLAYTVTITIENVNLTITRDAYETVRLRTKLEKIKGWEVKSGGVTIENNQFVMPEQDVVVEAILEASTPKYMLTVENFGARSRSLKLANSEVVATATETNECIFIGWTAEGIVLTPEEEESKTISFNMPENEVTLIANYTTEVRTYEVSYNKNTEDEVTNMPENEIKTHGVNFIISNAEPVKEGYAFIGWNTEQDGSGTLYMPGGTYTENTGLTLYAQWIVAEYYQVKMEISNEKTISSIYEAREAAGRRVTITASDPEGYRFINWKVEGATLEDETAKTTTFTMPKNDVRIIAEYNNYKLKVLTNKENTILLQDESVKEVGKQITVTAPTFNGYTFSKWETEGITVENETEQTITFTMPKNEVTIIAYYEIYKVKMGINKENRMSSVYEMAETSGNVITIEAPTVNGYTFSKWETEGVIVENETAQETTFTMPKNDVKITAVYNTNN